MSIDAAFGASRMTKIDAEPFSDLEIEILDRYAGTAIMIT